VILQTPDVAHLERWFASRNPEMNEVRIVELKRSFPGMSRETWFMDVEWKKGAESGAGRYVLRTPLPGGVSLAPDSLEYEAEIFRILGRTEVPVPKLLWFETDPLWMIDGDRPFMVREMTPGVLEPRDVRNTDPRYDGQRVAMVKELVANLARLHSLDWKSLGFGEFMRVPKSVESCAEMEIDLMIERINDRTGKPYPAAVEALLSLKERLPPAPERIVLRKENNGLGEEIWADEERPRIVAMSDWETASLGDPALDLAVALRTTGWAWNLEEMLDWYVQCGGSRIAPESVQFYSVIWAARMVSSLPVGTSFFSAQRDRRLQLVTLGLFTHLAESGLARAANF
jgi:aminoglycoside phosphotransferase (APT) family kinase protein